MPLPEPFCPLPDDELPCVPAWPRAWNSAWRNCWSACPRPSGEPVLLELALVELVPLAVVVALVVGSLADVPPAEAVPVVLEAAAVAAGVEEVVEPAAVEAAVEPAAAEAGSVL